MDNKYSPITAVRELGAQLPELILLQENELQNANERMRSLEAAGLIYATEHWRNGKYLYLIYPQVNGQRERKYIGSNPDRIAEARAGIQRAIEYDGLTAKVKSIESRLSMAQSHLRSVLRFLRADGDNSELARRSFCHHENGDT
jgi:hypothetical protein